VDTVSGLTTPDKLQLLQYLAWCLSVNNMVETTKDDVIERIRGRLSGMPMVAYNAADVMEHLINRSGVIREPALGRVDFVHRTFQEYLTAREAAEQAFMHFLVDRAHLDTWRETVVMAAGHANAPLRRELLTGLLSRADQDTHHARPLRLLAASCLETMPSVDPPELLQRVQSEFSVLVPPRNRNEAGRLSAVGEPALNHLPRDSQELLHGSISIRTSGPCGPGGGGGGLLSHGGGASSCFMIQCK
jgi:hypothetical protein